MKPISYFDFNRKRFIKLLKDRVDKYYIVCKLYKSDNSKDAMKRFRNIIELVNLSLRKKETFDSNNIFIIIEKLENFDAFIHDFSISIKNTEDVDSLKDRHIAFFKYQQELETFLKDNNIEPKSLELPT